MPRAKTKKIKKEDPELDDFLGVAKKKRKKKLTSKSTRKRTVKRKRSKKMMEKDLKKIYEDENGEIPDMSKIHYKKKGRAKLILAAFAVFFATLAILSWAGFLFFGQGEDFSGEKVNLEIISPDTAKGGEEIEYIVKYSNSEEIPLGQGEIDLRYPENFIFKEAIPTPSVGNNLWQLGSLPTGEMREIRVLGSLRGEVDSLETMQAVFSYKPGNFNSNFQRVASAITKIEEPSFELEISGPSRVLAGGENSFKVKYKNVLPVDLENVRIMVDSPEDFSFKEVIEEKEKNTWDVELVEAEKEEEFEFVGFFGNAVEGKRELNVKIGFVNGDNFVLQTEAVVSVDVAQGALLLNLIMNGDTDNRSVNFEETLSYTVSYKNKDQVDIGDIEFDMFFESTARNNLMVLDWSALSDKNRGIIVGEQISPELRKGKITWTKRQISELGLLAPGEEGTIDFRIKVKPFASFKDWDTSDFVVKSWVVARIGKVAEEEGEEVIEGNRIEMKVNSDLALVAGARYFNDDNIAVGSGSLPPNVDEKSAYRIFWTLSNTLHEIENIKVSTVLPENVDWSDKIDLGSGEVTYDKKTRKVEWTLNKMPLNIKEVGINFEINIIPEEADKGKLLTLTENTVLQGIDKSTGGTITRIAFPLTSNLDGDPMAEGKGIVR